MVLIVSILSIIIDQWTKKMASDYLRGSSPIEIIKDFFYFHYVENKGAAFGVLQNRRILFLIITSLIIVTLVVFIYKNYSQLTILTKISFGLLIGGAIGNLIDRIRFGYVIDFISFRFGSSYSFPVFNIADICIVVSTAVIAILVIFDKQVIGD